MINHFTEIEIDIVTILKDYQADCEDHGLSCSQIAKILKKSLQSIAYNLTKLKDRKIVLCVEPNKQYYLQPFLAQNDVHISIIQAFTIIMQEYQDLILIPKNCELTEDQRGNIFYDAMVISSLLAIANLLVEED